MTDFKSELREIIDSYYRSRELDERLYEQGENSHKTMLIDVETSTTKAESDIIALFIKQLPEEKRPAEMTFNMNEIQVVEYDSEIIGYNACLADIKSRISK